MICINIDQHFAHKTAQDLVRIYTYCNQLQNFPKEANTWKLKVMYFTRKLTEGHFLDDIQNLTNILDHLDQYTIQYLQPEYIMNVRNVMRRYTKED